MTLNGILSSPHQRRNFLLVTSLLLGISIAAVILISIFAPNKPLWGALNSILISLVASGFFAIFGGFFIRYFFVDPNEVAASSVVLPEDIGVTLRTIAAAAMNYRISVRTGRHFRADILPKLVERARETRSPMRIEVVLLDLRDDGVCQRYASYRKDASFDREKWNDLYVKKEVAATVLALLNASRELPSLVEIQIFLSKRLSIFRIEGSSDEILVTREDPKDTACRYHRTHRDFGAFLTEFDWIRDEAYAVTDDEALEAVPAFRAMFDGLPGIVDLENAAREVMHARSPYVR